MWELGSVFCLSGVPGIAQPQVFPNRSWTVDPPFTDAEARNNLSDVNCADA